MLKVTLIIEDEHPLEEGSDEVIVDRYTFRPYDLDSATAILGRVAAGRRLQAGFDAFKVEQIRTLKDKTTVEHSEYKHLGWSKILQDADVAAPSFGEIVLPGGGQICSLGASDVE